MEHGDYPEAHTGDLGMPSQLPWTVKGDGTGRSLEFIQRTTPLVINPDS